MFMVSSVSSCLISHKRRRKSLILVCVVSTIFPKVLGCLLLYVFVFFAKQAEWQATLVFCWWLPPSWNYSFAQFMIGRLTCVCGVCRFASAGKPTKIASCAPGFNYPRCIRPCFFTHPWLRSVYGFQTTTIGCFKRILINFLPVSIFFYTHCITVVYLFYL